MLVALFGKNGAGKTMLTVQLAQIAAERGQFVGIVSTEIRYGVIQRALGKKVDEAKSIKLAILDSKNIKKYATAFTENIYFYSMADVDDITSHVIEDESLLAKFVEAVKAKFDLVLVDCTDRATDDLTAAFLKQTDLIVNIVESSPDGIAFFNAHKPLRETFYSPEKEVIVLNKNIETNLNQETAQRLIGNKIDFVIPYMPAVFENKLEQKADKHLKKIVSEFYQAFFVIDEAESKAVAQVKKKPVFGFKKKSVK